MDGSLSHLKGILDRRKQRQEKKNGKFEKKSKLYLIKSNKLEFSEPSTKELTQIKKSIRDKLQRCKRKEVILLILVIVMLLIIIFNFI